MKRIRLLSVLGLLLVATVAFSQDVRYNFDKNADFSKFKTYKWVTLKDAQTVNDLVSKQIVDAVDAELATKGLTKVTDDSANLYIGYQVGIGQEKEFTSFNSDWGYGGGWYRGGWYGGMGGTSTTTGQTSTIYIGQLALDMYDSANKDLAWRGVASKTHRSESQTRKTAKEFGEGRQEIVEELSSSSQIATVRPQQREHRLGVTRTRAVRTFERCAKLVVSGNSPAASMSALRHYWLYGPTRID